MEEINYTEKDLERFILKLEYEYLPDGKVDTEKCILFTTYIDQFGYGKFWFNGRFIKAHRFSYMVKNGQIPENLVIRHKNICHKPNCINPNHLEIGSQKDNVNDMILFGNHAYGERNGPAKKTNNEIIQMIKDIYFEKFKSYDEICENYNITNGQLSTILNGKKWNLITEPVLKELNISYEDLKKKILKNTSGSNNPMSKLNWDIVNKIRQEYINGKTRKELSKKYNVHNVTIGSIVNNKSWIQ